MFPGLTTTTTLMPASSAALASAMTNAVTLKKKVHSFLPLTEYYYQDVTTTEVANRSLFEDGCQTDSKPQHKTTTLNISVFHKASLCRSLPSSHRSIHPGSLYVILLADKHQTKQRILSLLIYLPRVTSVRNVISSG